MLQVPRAHRPVMVFSIYVKINNGVLTNRDGRRPFHPIAREGRRKFEERTLRVICGGDAQMFLWRVLRFVFDDQMEFPAVLEQCGVDRTESWIEKQPRRRE